MVFPFLVLHSKKYIDAKLWTVWTVYITIVKQTTLTGFFLIQY